MDAIWIDASQKEDAIAYGYTVVDPSTVISTHITELIKSHADELLTRQDVQELLENVKKTYPVVVEDVLKVASIGLIQKVLKELLAQQIPIKDMLTILETISDIAEVTKNVDVIVEQVRARLARIITKQYVDETKTMKILTLAPSTEQKLIENLQDRDGYKDLVLNISQINSLISTMSDKAKEVLEKGIAPVILVVDPLLRKSLADLFKKFGLDIVVLSHAEIDTSAKFEVLGSVEIEDL